MSASPGKARRAEAREAKLRKEEREEALRAARLARAAERKARSARLKRRLAREVLYAGEGVSGRLSDKESDAPRLERLGLPVLRDAKDLADLLAIEMGTLRWLTFHREVADTAHYRQFEVPKRSGGTRVLSAPRQVLRAVQRRVREAILAKLPAPDAAHAFVPGRSTLTNATPHVGRRVLVKLDIRDFFGSIGFVRVRGMLEGLGYSGMVSTLLALLCTEAPRLRAEIDGRHLYVATGPRALPQGAPTSPDITTWIGRRIDRRLSGYAKKNGWTYTRYADDLAFSSDRDSKAYVGALLGTVRHVLREEGFRVHPDKVIVARSGRQQRVTGVVVNERPSLPRAALRRFRAAVHRVSKDGFRSPAERKRLLGYASYVHMVKPELGEKLLAALRAAGGGS